jgi:hypothetical protein
MLQLGCVERPTVSRPVNAAVWTLRTNLVISALVLVVNAIERGTTSSRRAATGQMPAKDRRGSQSETCTTGVVNAGMVPLTRWGLNSDLVPINFQS